MGDDNKILYGHIEQLITRNAPQPVDVTFGPTPQHETYPTKTFRLGNSGRAKKAAQKWTKWRETNNIEDEEALEEGVEGVYEIGYLRGAEETTDLILAFVDNLCREYPSIHSVQAIKDLQNLLKRERS